MDTKPRRNLRQWRSLQNCQLCHIRRHYPGIWTDHLGRQIPIRKNDRHIYNIASTGTRYLSTTLPDHKICLNRFTDTQLILFGCYSYSTSFRTSGRQTIFHVCQNPVDPIHYLIKNHGLPNIWQTNYSLFIIPFSPKRKLTIYWDHQSSPTRRAGPSSGIYHISCIKPCSKPATPY